MSYIEILGLKKYSSLQPNQKILENFSPKVQNLPFLTNKAAKNISEPDFAENSSDLQNKGKMPFLTSKIEKSKIQANPGTNRQKAIYDLNENFDDAFNSFH